MACLSELVGSSDSSSPKNGGATIGTVCITDRWPRADIEPPSWDSQQTNRQEKTGKKKK